MNASESNNTSLCCGSATEVRIWKIFATVIHNANFADGKLRVVQNRPHTAFRHLYRARLSNKVTHSCGFYWVDYFHSWCRSLRQTFFGAIFHCTTFVKTATHKRSQIDRTRNTKSNAFDRNYDRSITILNSLNGYQLPKAECARNEWDFFLLRLTVCGLLRSSSFAW